MQLFYTNNYDNTAYKPVSIRVGYNRPWCKKSLNVMGVSKAESDVLSHFKKKTNQQHIYYQLYLEVQKVMKDPLLKNIVTCSEYLYIRNVLLYIQG